MYRSFRWISVALLFIYFCRARFLECESIRCKLNPKTPIKTEKKFEKGQQRARANKLGQPIFLKKKERHLTSLGFEPRNPGGIRLRVRELVS